MYDTMFILSFGPVEDDDSLFQHTWYCCEARHSDQIQERCVQRKRQFTAKAAWAWKKKETTENFEAAKASQGKEVGAC